MVKWTEASQSVIHTIEQMVARYHPILSTVSICAVFRSEPAVNKGTSVYANIAKFPKNIIPLVNEEYEFLIWVYPVWWETANDKSRDAIIDHQLCHINPEKLTLRGHDVEEFWSVIQNHGLWTPNLRENRSVLEFATQIPLLQEEQPKGKVGTISASLNALNSALEEIGAESVSFEVK